MIQVLPPAATIRRGALSALQPGLVARGHTVSVVNINGGLQGIVLNGMRGRAPAPFAKAPGRGRWAGGADPRRRGRRRGSMTPTYPAT